MAERQLPGHLGLDLVGRVPAADLVEDRRVEDPALGRVFEDYWSTVDESATDRMKLFHLAWDLLGSEFAMCHDQDEKFHVGPRFIVRDYNHRHTLWDDYEGLVDSIMAGCGTQ